MWMNAIQGKKNEFRAIICGYANQYCGTEKFSSLVLGIYENKKLRYIGNVSAGFDRKIIEQVYNRVKPLITLESPFENKLSSSNTIWIHPKITCKVKFLEWTKDGMMRHPIFQKLRQYNNILDSI